jgi:YD repeat-containing protein
MHHTANTSLRRTLAWLTFSLLTVNCQDHAQNPAAEPSCRVGSQVVNTETSTSKTGTTTQNTLNADRRLTQQVILTTSTSGTTTTSSEQTNNYQYDVNGLLTTRTGQFRSTAANGTVTPSTFENRYSYQNGRLTSHVFETVSATGTRSTQTRTYEYDGQGALSRFVLTQATGQTIQTYLGGKQTDCEFVSSTGVRTKPFKFNAMGFVSEAPYFLLNHTGRFTYDAQGNLVKEEFYDAPGNRVGYHDHQYDMQKQNPNAATPTLLFKGHPAVTELTTTSFLLTPIYGPALRTNSKRYTGTALTNEETFVYDYNANGFPTSITLLSKNSAGATTSQTKTTYTYQCL